MFSHLTSFRNIKRERTLSGMAYTITPFLGIEKRSSKGILIDRGPWDDEYLTHHSFSPAISEKGLIYDPREITITPLFYLCWEKTAC